MSMRALANVYTVNTGWAPVAVAATKTSSAIDFANCIENVITITPGLWTDGTHTLTLTESGTAGGAGTYTTVAAAGMVFGGNQTGFVVVSSTATAQTPQKVSYIGLYQYVKVVDTVTGGTTGAILGVQAIVKTHKQNSST